MLASLRQLRLDLCLERLHLVDLGLEFIDTDIVHLVHYTKELDDEFGPAVHGEGEGGLRGDALVSIDHLLRHPNVPMVHLLYKVDVLLAYLADIELL